MKLRWALLLIFVTSVANLEAGRWIGSQEGKAVAKEWSDLYGQSVVECSKSLKEIAAAFCRERVTGCEHFESLMRRGDGLYECRCR